MRSGKLEARIDALMAEAIRRDLHRAEGTLVSHHADPARQAAAHRQTPAPTGARNLR